MDYYSDTQYAQTDPYAPPAQKKQRPDNRPDNRICEQDDVVVLKEKVMIPTEKYPGYNFVGSILGPGGSILKELQKAVNAKIAIFGKGSMRKDKEAELMNSEDEKYAHLKEPLHVLIDVKAPRADAHIRMHHALVEVYKFMSAPEQQEQHFDHGPYAPPGGGYGDAGYGGGGGGGYGGGGYNGGGGGYGGGGPPRGGRGAPRGGPRGGRGGPRGGRGGPRGAPRGGGGY